MKSKKELIHQLNIAQQDIGNLTVLFTNTISEQIGLSATEFECLDTIGNNQPITAGQLASLTGLSTGGITGVVDRLEQAGYVRRKRDTADRRRVLLEQVFDKKTIQRVRKLYGPMSQKFEEVCQEFTAEELCIVLRYHHRTIEMVHNLLGHPPSHRPHNHREA